MWRQLRFVIPSAVLLGVAGTATEVTDLIHQAQVRDRAAAHAREVQQAGAFRLQERQFAQVTQIEIQLGKTQEALASANSKADDLQGQVDKLKQQVAVLQAYTAGYGSGVRVLSTPVTSGPNHFAFGYCTWYVASRRFIPWMGNAGTWFWSAQAYGWPTGPSPRPGAIEVSAASIWGHVAWVEAVYPNGSWLVSEMNYYGWDVVDNRLVLPGREPVIGFIY